MPRTIAGLAEMLDERVEVESVLERKGTNLVIVTIRLPGLSEAERLSTQEWVQFRLQNMQDDGGAPSCLCRATCTGTRAIRDRSVRLSTLHGLGVGTDDIIGHS